MEIQTLNPATPRQRQHIEAFLKRNALRIDDMNYYAAVLDDDGEMIAGGGLKDDVIKCVAVDDAHKGEAIANTLVSHLISHANQEGYSCIKLFTKRKNRQLFESLSFRLLAEAPEAILMETGIGGISNTVEALKKIKEESEKYKEYNKECKEDSKKCKENTSYLNTSIPQHLNTTMQPTGCIVMNCNPFTLGHRYLIEQAAKQVERLYVMVVREDCSLFAYTERKAMVEQGVADIENVNVIDGSDYAISRATFPTYFLKRLDDAADTQMLLDLDLFRRHIAPALGATVRFVGTEPTDQLTRRAQRRSRDKSTGERQQRSKRIARPQGNGRRRHEHNKTACAAHYPTLYYSTSRNTRPSCRTRHHSKTRSCRQGQQRSAPRHGSCADVAQHTCHTSLFRQTRPTRFRCRHAQP